MTDERWDELVENMQNQGQVELTTEPLYHESAMGREEAGTKDILVFKRAGNTYKVVRENKPVVLDKKMFYSHRQGDTARTEYKLSDTEMSHKVKVYREIDIDEWEELSADSLGL